MAYKANIPAAGDQISVSQDDLLKNFQAINTFVAKDHYAFGTASEGQHCFNQGAAPTVATATQVGIYAAALGGNPELYINKAASQIPFTAALKNAKGWTILPSGIIMKWGTGNAAHGVNPELAFAVDAAATFTVAPTVTISSVYPGGGSDHGVFLSAITVTGVSVYNRSNSAQDYYYIAIGY